MDPRITLIGLVVGVLVGISGVGGSSLVTPLMILMMGIQPLVAIGTDLVYSAPTKLVGALVHRQQGTIDGRVVGRLCLGGVPAAVVGLLTLWMLRARLPLAALNAALQRGVGVLLLLVAIVVVALPLLTWMRTRRAARLGRPDPSAVADGGDLKAPLSIATKCSLIALGALVGFCVSLTSIGSGSITLPLLYLLLPAVKVRKLVGVDVAFAAVLVPIAALGHAQMGSVNWGLAANLLLGSVPGVIVGSKLCRYLPELLLRPAIAGVLVFAASRLI
jgi:uncharacterized membrane protein YfcA